MHKQRKNFRGGRRCSLGSQRMRAGGAASRERDLMNASSREGRMIAARRPTRASALFVAPGIANAWLRADPRACDQQALLARTRCSRSSRGRRPSLTDNGCA